MNRSDLESYILNKYSVAPEYPWAKYPTFAVFRHQTNKKWFAVIMYIPISKFGIYENRKINVVNLKINPEILDEVWQDYGIFPAYHMNKENWISVFLDGSVPDDTVKILLDASFDQTL